MRARYLPVHWNARVTLHDLRQILGPDFDVSLSYFDLMIAPMGSCSLWLYLTSIDEFPWSLSFTELPVRLIALGWLGVYESHEALGENKSESEGKLGRGS